MQNETKADKILQLALSLNNARDMDEILLQIRDRIIKIMDSEKATIYALDPRTGELFSKVKVKDEIDEIRIPASDKSIAGYAANRGILVNLADVHDEAGKTRYPGLRFDDSWDKKCGYTSRAILAAPLRYKETGLQGVIQLVHSAPGRRFTAEDEETLLKVAEFVAVAFYNQSRIVRKPAKFDLLLEKQLISQEDLNKAIGQARKESDPIKGDVAGVLVKDFKVQRERMGASLARYYKCDFIGYSKVMVIPAFLLQGQKAEFLKRNFWIPIAKEGDEVTILIDNPSDLDKIATIEKMLPACRHKFCVSLREDIFHFIETAFGGTIGTIVEGLGPEGEETPHVEDVLKADAPAIVQTLRKIIQDAFDKGASDIHIEPYPVGQPTEVRLRVDGDCCLYTTIPRGHTKALVNLIKIESNLKLDERRVPQSGKFRHKYNNRDVELRVEMTPTAGDNEDVVMRVLASGRPMALEKINLSESNLCRLKNIISKPYGLILVVGPTGSGKTTTLHSVLGALNKPDVKIWTAEDPVEITQRGLRQVQVNMHIKPEPLDFAAAMRSFLRADPDIIMVGEMRDKETATIAIEASLTGHLVLSTLHTNSAPESVTRLIEIGLNPINFADALLGILAQRLVRTLCGDCKEQYVPSREEFEDLRREYGLELSTELGEYGAGRRLFRPKPNGCPNCGNTGYRGRTGIHELLLGDKIVKRMIVKCAAMEELRAQAVQGGMRTLKMDGIQKVLKGQTDMAQVRMACIE